MKYWTAGSNFLLKAPFSLELKGFGQNYEWKRLFLRRKMENPVRRQEENKNTRKIIC